MVKHGRPAKRASIAAWRSFARDQGMPHDEIGVATKTALIAYCDAVDEAARKAAAAPDAHTTRGEVECSTFEDLRRLGLHTTPLGRSSLKIARHLDEATSGGEAAAAARELRMSLAATYAAGKPLSPPTQGDDGDGVVIGEDRLNAAREAAAGVKQGKGATR